MTEERPFENVASAALPQELPQALKKFMAENDVREDVYEGAEDLERHIRINPRNPITLLLLAAQLGHEPRPIGWIPGLYSMPSSVPLAACDAYKCGQVYGIDVASAAAVQILDPMPGDVVLDMCCAPGAKLCLTADIVTKSSADGSVHLPGFVVGVDVSPNRLASTKTLLRKYQQRNIRLYLADGTKCQIPCPRLTSAEEAAKERQAWLREVANAQGNAGPQRSRRKRRQEPLADEREGPLRYFFESALEGHWGWGARAGAAADDQPQDGPATRDTTAGESDKADESRRRGEFDKVLVDAECTHDGSVRHMAKIGKKGWEQLSSRTFEQGRMEGLQGLQRGLLQNGFRHLRVGGSLVYSTCSFSKQQNEEIVQWLLDTEKQAVLAPIPSKLSLPSRPGHIEHAVRFEPKVSGSSGLFVAKIVKL